MILGNTGKMKIFVVDKIRETLEPQEDIIFAYLFGSYATNKANKFSDIDIAVYLNGGDFAERKLELLVLLSRELKFDKIDLVILNKVSPTVMYSVLSTGRLLFSRDEELRLRFITKLLKEYMEMDFYRKRFWKAMSKRIREGKFGI